MNFERPLKEQDFKLHMVLFHKYISLAGMHNTYFLHGFTRQNSWRQEEHPVNGFFFLHITQMS